MSAVHDGTANVYKKVRQMTNACSKCRNCIGYDGTVNGYFCDIVGFIEAVIANNEEIECELYADIRDDAAN